MSEWAPHTCTGKHEDGDACASPAYIGFGVPPKCTQLGCPHYDSKTAVEYSIEQDKLKPKTKTMSIKDVISIKIDGKDIKSMPIHGFGTPLVWSSLGYDPGPAFGGTIKDPDPLHVEQQPGESDEEYTHRVNKLVGNVPDEVLPPTEEEQEQLDFIREKIKEAIMKTFKDNNDGLKKTVIKGKMDI